MALTVVTRDRISRPRDVSRGASPSGRPPPVADRLPNLITRYSDGIPDRTVKAEIVIEWQPTSGFMNDRHGKVNIQIAEIDSVKGATAKASERGSASFYLTQAESCYPQQHNQ